MLCYVNKLNLQNIADD